MYYKLNAVLSLVRIFLLFFSSLFFFLVSQQKTESTVSQSRSSPIINVQQKRKKLHTHKKFSHKNFFLHFFLKE